MTHSPDRQPTHRVIIVGGGLAGMAAAVALESVGIDVTLLESRRNLGGRAGSFQDPQTGEELDNCQHVLLGCCTNLLDFYRRIGALDRIHFEPSIRFMDERGRGYSLGATPGIPAPLHLTGSLLQFNLLAWSERIELSRAMLAMLRLGKSGRKKLADLPFGQWLDEHGQSPELVRKIYEPVLVGALNEEVRPASSEFALEVFQDSLLANRAGCRMGVPACTLSELYHTLPCRDVRLSTRAAEVILAEDRATGIRTQSGETLLADAVILATNHHSLDKYLPAKWITSDPRFAGLEKLESVPILGAHLWFDRPVMTESHAALLGGGLQWIFRKDAAGQAIHGVISAARHWLNRDREEMLASFEQQVRSILPLARHAKLLRGSVVIEKRATFAALPGVDRYRPDQAPDANGIQSLYLAGDYTRTGWPATMEGAVRSGYLAASALLNGIASHSSIARRSFLVEDLPIEWPSRWIGLAR